MTHIKKLSLFFVIVLTFIISAQSAFAKVIQKEFEYTTKDLMIVKSTLTYEKIDKVQKYPTIVLIHSLGYSSADWGSLIPTLNAAGYAVLAIDLRGHGKSIYDTNLKQRTWIYFTKKSFLKIPNDIVEVINDAAKANKKISLDNMAIVGADIGANAAILASKSLAKKPKALVLISPTLTFKGLYIPITLTELGIVPVLAMASQKDTYSMKQEVEISKFAQGSFFVKNYPYGGMGMMMIKSNPTMVYDITKWLMRYL